MSFCNILMNRSSFIINLKIKILQSLKVSPDKFYSSFLSRCKRTFFTILQKQKKASLTVEAAFVVPFFLFVTCNLLYITNFFYEDADRITKMSENAKNFAVYMYAADKLVDGDIVDSLGFGELNTGTFFDDNIDLYDVHTEHSLFVPFGFGDYLTIQRATCHMWTGYHIDGEEDDGDENKVYITPTGECYHTFRDCRYISIKIENVPVAELSLHTNSSGRHYRECERCKDIEPGYYYYVTPSGVAYHNTITCSSLKRTVMVVTLEEALEQEKRLCSKCGEREE